MMVFNFFLRHAAVTIDTTRYHHRNHDAQHPARAVCSPCHRHCVTSVDEELSAASDIIVGRSLPVRQVVASLGGALWVLQSKLGNSLK